MKQYNHYFEMLNFAELFRCTTNFSFSDSLISKLWGKLRKILQIDERTIYANTSSDV